MSQCFKGLLLILHVPWEGQAPLEDLSQGQSSNISAGIWDSPGASIIFLFWLCVNEEFEHKIYSLITPLYLGRLLGETQSLGDIVKQTGKLKKEFGKWNMFAFLWETELCVQIRKGKTPWAFSGDARKGVYWSMYPTCMIRWRWKCCHIRTSESRILLGLRQSAEWETRARAGSDLQGAVMGEAAHSQVWNDGCRPHVKKGMRRVVQDEGAAAQGRGGKR